MAGIEQGSGDDAHRVGEIDDPRVIGAPAPCARAAISSTVGTVRIAFANPPAPVVSCPMQPHAQGNGLVRESSLLAADADLDQDDVGAFERPVELPRHG